jgi:hypothetical protein
MPTNIKPIHRYIERFNVIALEESIARLWLALFLSLYPYSPNNNNIEYIRAHYLSMLLIN